MTQRRIVILSLAVLFLAVSFAPAAKDKDDDDAKAHKVTIQNLKYDPAKLTIKPGETVLWINKDDNDHTVIADDDSFKSDNLSTGDKFSHTFDKKGTFKYHCKYHPRMKGQVLVTD
jgi:plastocyanin